MIFFSSTFRLHSHLFSKPFNVPGFAGKDLTLDSSLICRMSSFFAPKKKLENHSQHPKNAGSFFGKPFPLATHTGRKLALGMSSHHRKEALEQISSGLKLKFLEFMKLYGKTGLPPELDVSTKGFSAAKTSTSTSFKESFKGTTSSMGTSSTSFKEDEIQDELEVLSSSSSSDESDEGQDISDLQLGPLELKEPTEQVSNHIDETESSSSEMAALEDLVVEEAERDRPKKRAYGCTGMKGVSRRIDSKTGTVSYQAWPVPPFHSQGGLAKSQLLGP